MADEGEATRYAVFVNSLCEGPVPLWDDGEGRVVTHATEREAQIEIAEMQIEKLREFLAGERDFEDAMTVEEYCQVVVVEADGVVRPRDCNIGVAGG